MARYLFGMMASALALAASATFASAQGIEVGGKAWIGASQPQYYGPPPPVPYHGGEYAPRRPHPGYRGYYPPAPQQHRRAAPVEYRTPHPACARPDQWDMPPMHRCFNPSGPAPDRFGNNGCCPI